MTPASEHSETELRRLDAAEALAKRLDRPMGVLGLLFLFVILGQLLAKEQPLVSILTVLGWLFWAVFAAEFFLRAYIAGFGRRFWKRNWWQLVFLLVPFLRFFRALQALRVLRVTRLARLGGIFSAGVRGTRSAGRLLTSRIAWLGAVTAVVILASSQLLYAAGSHDRYSEALYEAAVTTITGDGITSQTPFAQFVHVLLAIYSVVIFATLAGSIGAFFLRREASEAPQNAPQ
ncbi:ion transporter [Lysobacter korlensis]|uniref:Ion transporter n=1 Tax=Lysobacter korlensis TaxID=553636 RepID=A0ABV6RW22_9GAMM